MCNMKKHYQRTECAVGEYLGCILKVGKVLQSDEGQFAKELIQRVQTCTSSLALKLGVAQCRGSGVKVLIWFSSTEVIFTGKKNGS